LGWSSVISSGELGVVGKVDGHLAGGRVGQQVKLVGGVDRLRARWPVRFALAWPVGGERGQHDLLQRRGVAGQPEGAAGTSGGGRGK